jgi:hypothetical protein
VGPHRAGRGGSGGTGRESVTQALPGILTTTAAPSGAAVAWHYDPWRDRRGTSALAALSALGLCALVLWARLPFVLASALSVACIASFSPALTPVSCRVDADGVARRGVLGWERRPWAEVRRIEPVRGGVLVSPFARRHWLDATRAMLLPIPAARRDELRQAIERARVAHAA